MIEVLSYTKIGSHVTVKDFFTYPLPDECVINGVILDGSPIIEGLRFIKDAHPQMFKDTSLVLDGSFVYTKRINVPGKLNKWMYYQVIRDEFKEIATDPENLICDHLLLGINEDGSKQILACAVERTHTEAYLAILNDAGIEPKKVRLGIQAILRYISSKPEFGDQPFVLKIVDGELVASDELLVTAGEVSEFDFGTFFLKGQPVIDELDEDLWVIPNFRAWIPA